MIGLGDLPGGDFASYASGISGNGSTIVGTSVVATGSEAFIWDATNGMRELDVVLTALGLDLTGWTLRTPHISHDGLTIVGYGINPSGNEEAWIAVIPEPGTALLVGCGLVGLAMKRRRTREA